MTGKKLTHKGAEVSWYNGWPGGWAVRVNDASIGYIHLAAGRYSAYRGTGSEAIRHRYQFTTIQDAIEWVCGQEGGDATERLDTRAAVGHSTHARTTPGVAIGREGGKELSTRRERAWGQ